MRVLTLEEFSPLFSMVRMLFVLILRKVDLPPRWWTIPLTEFIPLGHPGHDIPGLDVTIQDGDGRPDDWLPERVIIYTTHELLALLSCCRKASADGTFNVRNN